MRSACDGNHGCRACCRHQGQSPRPTSRLASLLLYRSVAAWRADLYTCCCASLLPGVRRSHSQGVQVSAQLRAVLDVLACYLDMQALLLDELASPGALVCLCLCLCACAKCQHSDRTVASAARLSLT